MVWSVRLFTLRGIEMRVHASFVLILVWAGYYWSQDVADPLQGALFGTVATLLLFLCVTLHELGHSFQALAYGIRTKDITLYPIGGVARLEEIPTDPRKEFRITLAGPLVNVVIFVTLLALDFVLPYDVVSTPSRLTDQLEQGTWSGLLPYIAYANLWLVVFNLVPAYPMDGGRILRSLLAMRMGTRRATRIAMLVGQALAFGFVLIGLATGNIFLIVIAVLVWMGAGAEGQDVVVRDVLGDTQAGQVMIRNFARLTVTDPIHRAVELTLSTAQSDFPVVDGQDRVVGFLTMADLVRALHEQRARDVREIMMTDVPLARVDEPVVEIQKRLGDARLRALPVVDDDARLVGVLTLNDIGEAFQLIAATERRS